MIETTKKAGPGDKVFVRNDNDFAQSYELDYGDYGLLLITVPPRGGFIVRLGNVKPVIKVEGASDPGLKPAPCRDRSATAPNEMVAGKVTGVSAQTVDLDEAMGTDMGRPGAA